jgi:histone H3/H4
MAKAKAGKAKAAPKMAAAETLLIASKVRAAVKDSDCNFAGDALDGLNMYVHWLVTQATERAKANGRKTVRAHDFIIP